MLKIRGMSINFPVVAAHATLIFNFLDSKKMGDGDNWDDQVDFAKARRTKLRRFHVKEHLSAKFEKKRQVKIIGTKGKKFRKSPDPSAAVLLSSTITN